MRLYALSKDDQGNVIETEVASAEKTLRLNRSNEPLVAAMDTLKLTYPAPAAGDYVVKMTSDRAFDQANRDDRVFTVEGETTAISNLKVDGAARHDEWYDISGSRLNGNPTQRGIYLRKGKKIIIK